MSVYNSIKEIQSKNTQRIGWEEYFISLSRLVSFRSSCKKLHVGAVIVKDRRVVSTGYNGHPSGCSHRSEERDGHELRTIHAEINAVVDAARRGVAVENAILYVTHQPCIKCTQAIIGAGIKEVVYDEVYKSDPIAIDLMLEAGVKLRKFEVVTKTKDEE